MLDTANENRQSDRTGLTSEQVAERVRSGRVNEVPDIPTRTVREILRANILTPFNALLGGLLTVILVVGPLQDALFGVVLVSNALIGIVQELRAKRTLDRLAVLSAPAARVVRDGSEREIPVGSVVEDDLLLLAPGEQVIVDGEVVESLGLEVDESLLTGESEPVSKSGGEEVLSGSFVAAGSGSYVATRIGKQAYAVDLTEEARRFTLVHSELRSGIDRVIRLVGLAMLPTATLLLISQLGAHDTVEEAVRGTVAGVVAMVPEGLVLLTSVAFAAGVVRLARINALVQELPAVETLARVDVICLDKTGTITEGDIKVTEIRRLTDDPDVDTALASLVAIEPNPNATLTAIAQRFSGGDPWEADAAVPFSSARKWSGATFTGRGSWVLGAPEVLLRDGDDGRSGTLLRRTIETDASTGARVLLLAHTDASLSEAAVPRVRPQAVLLLADSVRADAPETLRYFGEEGVQIKVISGDHPRTVSAVAERAGVPGWQSAVDARSLPEDPDELAVVVDKHSVFGRVTPQQKRAMIAALKARRHVVAMTGDGVNDVLALKDADIGIAMGSGSPASRAVSQVVLMDGSFTTLPAALAEGRRVINNIERVANLFLTKTVYSMLLALAVGVAGLPFPFLPRHLTLIGSLTIGIPAFFLALAPNRKRAFSGFVGRVSRFALPAGLLGAAATFSGYYLVQFEEEVSPREAKTMATLTLLAFGLLVLEHLSRPLTPFRTALIWSMVATFVAVVTIPPLKGFFELEMPPTLVVLAGIGLVAIARQILDVVIAWTRAPTQDSL